jgi:AmmeMemoRadiSam system protein A
MLATITGRTIIQGLKRCRDRIVFRGCGGGEFSPRRRPAAIIRTAEFLNRIRFFASIVSLTPAQRGQLLDIARDGLISRLRSEGEDAPPRVPEPSDAELTTPAGCFVSLHERGTHRLRGCVGRLDPETPLWRAVRETAGDVLGDPRFTDARVTLAEAPSLEIEVSVLSPPRQASNPLDFDPQTDGIYLVYGGRSGFFLPQVARETGWTKQQLLARLCEEKLGLPYDAWLKPEAKLFTFKVEVVGPEPV